MEITDIKITPEILKLIAEIDEFKGTWKSIQRLPKDRLASLKKIATIESIGSSTRIEGVKLSDQEIDTLLKGLGINSFHSRDEEEVAGYAQAMNTIFDNYTEIPLTENHIKQLHSILLKFSSKDKQHRGKYKKLSNNVEAFDINGKSIGIIFETSTPFDTPTKMTELVNWTNLELEKKQLHPLLIIGIFIVTFLAIHPFQDGNGRLSRILTTLLLIKENYSYVPFNSLEKIIEENKDNYYLSLRTAQKNIWTNQKNLNKWLIFFLQCLKKQKDVLDSKITKEKLLAVLNTPELSANIIRLIKDHEKLSISQIEKLTQANRNTIKLHLKKLVQENKLTKHGQLKGSWYSL